MKIWRCAYHGDADFGSIQSWHRTKQQAMASRSELCDDVSAVDVEAVNLPKTKDGIISWLNIHFRTDNG